LTLQRICEALKRKIMSIVMRMNKTTNLKKSKSPSTPLTTPPQTPATTFYHTAQQNPAEERAAPSDHNKKQRII